MSIASMAGYRSCGTVGSGSKDYLALSTFLVVGSVVEVSTRAEKGNSLSIAVLNAAPYTKRLKDVCFFPARDCKEKIERAVDRV